MHFLFIFAVAVVTAILAAAKPLVVLYAGLTRLFYVVYSRERLLQLAKDATF
jgi:hypothetical protein